MSQRHILLAAISLFIFVGCKTKPKNEFQDVTVISHNSEHEGSDSNKINGLMTVFFDFDKYSLSELEYKKLKGNADWIANNPQFNLTVEGHTDEAGSNEYNLALGERRAQFIRQELIKLGVKSDRLKTVSFGEEKPIDKNNDDSAYAKNRRANFVPINK